LLWKSVSGGDENIGEDLASNTNWTTWTPTMPNPKEQTIFFYSLKAQN